MTIMQQIGRASSEIEQRSKSRDWVALAKTLMLAKCDLVAARAIASERRLGPRVLDILERASSLDSMSALVDYKLLAESFIASLAPFSALDRILADNAFITVPVRTRMVTGSGAGIADGGVNELAPKIVVEMSLDGTYLSEKKTAAITVTSDELARLSQQAGRDLLETLLRRKIAVASDNAFIEVITGWTGAPSVPSTGDTPTAVIADLTTALAEMDPGAEGRLYLVLPAKVYQKILIARDAGGYLVQDGLIGNITVVGSNALTTDAVLLDAIEIAIDPGLTVPKLSNQATLDMAGGGSPSFSLWQNNCSAYLAERTIGVALLKDTAAVTIAGIGGTA